MTKRARPPPAPEPRTLHIDDLAPGGMGVAHVKVSTGEDTRAVFVPRVAIGDEVEALVDFSLRPARGRVLRLVAEGKGRVPAPCAYAETCGACDWLHLSREAQRVARESHISRAVPASMSHVPVTMHDAIPSLGYRTRARLHLRASGGRAILGPNGVGSHDVIDIEKCVVLHPTLDAALPRVSALLEGAHATGEVSLALGKGGKAVLELRWEGRLPAIVFGRMERAVADGMLAGANLYEAGSERPAVIGDASPEMIGADGALLRLAPGGFAQASEEGNRELGDRVLDLARQGGPPSRVVELYAGAGNFTVLLARAFEQVVAVESNERACEAARQNLAARGLKAKVTCADADDFPLPPKTDLVVLDPPRRGARNPCVALAASSVKAIVYVSCDPPTLGRDLEILAERFDLVALESFAMFPGTSHSETVALLRRKRRETR